MKMSPSGDEWYLPPDVLMEVLSRLPVKSIFQFRCVSKYWLHRIPNPNLISLHLYHVINFKLNSFNHTSRILTVEPGPGPGPGPGSKRFKIQSVQGFKASAILMTTPPSYTPLISNDGLVLMADDINYPRNLILVNPTLNTSLVLPPFPIRLTFVGFVYAMGFDPTANDFKVFAFRNPVHTDAPFSAMYTLSHGCWTTKNIDFDKNYRFALWRVVFTKGKAYWWGRCHGWNVVTFDMDAEKFSYLRLPIECVNRVDGQKICTAMDLFSLRGSIAIWYFSVLGFYIWVLDEVGHGADPIWRQFYHGVPTFDTIEFFLDIGVKNKFWLDDKCEKFYILTDGSKLLSYDFRRDEIKYIGVSYQWFELVDTYVESLLLSSQPGMDQPRA